MESTAQIIGESIVGFDKSASLWLNSCHCIVTDYIWMFFSNKYVWVLLYLAVFYFMYRRLGWKRALWALGVMVLMILCCDQTANLFKNWVCRLRPTHDEWMLSRGLNILDGPGGLYGFFSAHAANAFGFAICSLEIFKLDNTRSYKGYAWFIMIWAFLVAVSRIFVGRHFIGDVIVGSAVGLLVGWLWGLVYRRFIS